MKNEPHKPTQHALWEDALAFVLGTALCAVGVQFLTHLGLITGQTAGLGVLLAYASDLSFGVWFFLLNLPFYVLGLIRMGLRFTVKSFIAVALVSAMSEVFPHAFTIATLNIYFGALLSGALIGIGLIVLFRHGASLGGIGVLALFLQERIGIQAGWVQLGFDALLFLAAFAVLDWKIVALSLLGAAVVNVIVGVNHRQDRYIGR
ncbi:MAG: YitT family protein [Pseudomonadota bacterium]